MQVLGNKILTAATTRSKGCTQQCSQSSPSRGYAVITLFFFMCTSEEGGAKICNLILGFYSCWFGGTDLSGNIALDWPPVNGPRGDERQKGYLAAGKWESRMKGLQKVLCFKPSGLRDDSRRRITVESSMRGAMDVLGPSKTNMCGGGDTETEAV